MNLGKIAVVTLNQWWMHALQFFFYRRIVFCALLVQHCSVSHEVFSLFPASALFHDGNSVR